MSGSDDERGELGFLGRALPLPALIVVDGTVVACDTAGRSWGPGAGSEVPLVDWFRDEDADEVRAALTGGRGPVRMARLRESSRWVALHTRATGDRDEVVVILRDADDEQFVRAAVDAVADSTFVIDAAGANRWRSARLRERSGVPDEVAARRPSGERIHPEDLPLVFEAFAATRPGEPQTVVGRSRAVDDDDRWETIEITVWDQRDHEVIKGYLVQVRNLDEGRTIKAALSDADPQLLSLTEAAPVGIAVTDPAGQVVYGNPVARALLGHDLPSFGDADWLARARPEHRAELAEAFRSGLAEGVASEVVAAFASADDGERWVRVRVEPQMATDGTRTRGVIATLEDVTTEREAQLLLAAAEERMRHLATHDTLTGLPNRAALSDELERAIARHARSRDGMAVLFCDLDGFKPVNDRHGHAGGDVVLVEVAQRLRRAVRDVDFVARLGGDEFVVLCEGTGTDTAIVDQVSARLHDLVEQPLAGTVGAEAALSLSIGVAAVGPDDLPEADDLRLLSDQAMYEAKAAGPGGTVVRWVSAPR
jgi:diguanylate cyclase (GGDEF)-like protein/PAS domain S-box-containing protein